MPADKLVRGDDFSHHTYLKSVCSIAKSVCTIAIKPCIVVSTVVHASSGEAKYVHAQHLSLCPNSRKSNPTPIIMIAALNACSTMVTNKHAGVMACSLSDWLTQQGRHATALIHCCPCCDTHTLDIAEAWGLGSVLGFI